MASTNYPGSLDAYPVPNNGDTISVADHWLGPAVIGIETELGTDPAGTFTDVKSRLDSGLVEEVDQWVLSSNYLHSGGGAVEFLTANWARKSSDSFSQKGTGMSEASGVFSFPSTGYYKIDFATYNLVTSGSGFAYYGGLIYTTTNNSSFSAETENLNSVSAVNFFASTFNSLTFRVADIANYKIKTGVQAATPCTVLGSSANRTVLLFTKLGGL